MSQGLLLLYRAGTLCSACPDSLFNKSRTAAPALRPLYRERLGRVSGHDSTPLAASAWAIEELPGPHSLDATQYMDDLLMQHEAPYRRFLVLTEHGVYMIVQQRPVAELYAQMLSPLSQPTAFQHAATLAGLGVLTRDQALVYLREVYAARMIIRCKQFGHTYHDPLFRMLPVENRQVMWRDDMRAPGDPVPPVILESPFHDGVCLYLSRLLYHVWDESVVHPRQATPSGYSMLATFRESLRVLATHLEQLARFLMMLPLPSMPLTLEQCYAHHNQVLSGRLAANPMQYIAGISTDQWNTHRQKHREMVDQEHLQSVSLLVQRCREVVALLQALGGEHGCGSLDFQLPDVQLERKTFAQVFHECTEARAGEIDTLGQRLINALLRNAPQGLNEELARRCCTLHSPASASCAAARNILRRHDADARELLSAQRMFGDYYRTCLQQWDAEVEHMAGDFVVPGFVEDLRRTCTAFVTKANGYEHVTVCYDGWLCCHVLLLWQMLWPAPASDRVPCLV